MSSTNRGGKRSKADFYETPSWVVDRLLDVGPMLPPGRWLEPGAGRGAIINAVNCKRNDVDWTAVEMQSRFCEDLVETGSRVLNANFLRVRPRRGQEFAVALGNPPYRLAEEFIRHALLFCDEVLFLLRLNFLESNKRQDFYETYGAPDVFVLPTRPSFDERGNDSCAYAWMRWQGDRQQAGVVKILYPGGCHVEVPKTRRPVEVALHPPKKRGTNGVSHAGTNLLGLR